MEKHKTWVVALVALATIWAVNQFGFAQVVKPQA